RRGSRPDSHPPWSPIPTGRHSGGGRRTSMLYGTATLRRFHQNRSQFGQGCCGRGKLTLTHTTANFTLDPPARKQLEKRRRQEKDAGLPSRCSAALWLGQGRSPEAVAALLGVCPRTVRNWLHLDQRGGLVRRDPQQGHGLGAHAAVGAARAAPAVDQEIEEPG